MERLYIPVGTLGLTPSRRGSEDSLADSLSCHLALSGVTGVDADETDIIENRWGVRECVPRDDERL